MFRDWKISTFNGVLIASYFIPSWVIPACQIGVSPVHGLYSQPGNLAVAMFASDYLQLGAVAMMRFGWLLALTKCTVGAFFAIFLINALRTSTRLRGASDEALNIALVLGTIVSFISMLMASKVGEFHALRLHSTETLLLLSLGILTLVEGSRSGVMADVRSQATADSSAVDRLATQPVRTYPQAQSSAMS